MKIVELSRWVIGLGLIGMASASCTLLVGTFQESNGTAGTGGAVGTGGKPNATSTASGMGGTTGSNSGGGGAGTSSNSGGGGAAMSSSSGGGECKKDIDCTPQNTTCMTFNCLNKACVGSPAPKGLACTEMGGSFCNATGSCVECRSSSDCAQTGTSCVSATCSGDGVCGTQNAADHSTCSDSGGEVCLGGACVACITTADCSPGNNCQSDHTCIGQCSDGMKDGTETDKDCGGGSCPPCPAGDTCMADNDCVSTAACEAGVCVTCGGNYNQPCGSCNGVFECDGSCSISTPGNFGTSCGSCGGKIECDGSCSVATPPNLGHICTSIHCPCGYNLSGTIDCAGACVPDDSCSCCGAEPC